MNKITFTTVGDAGTSSQEVDAAALLAQRRATGWTTYSACAAIEGFDGEEHDEAEIVSAYQFLIDTGVIWTLQGFYGRAAGRLIAGGICTPAKR